MNSDEYTQKTTNAFMRAESRPVVTFLTYVNKEYYHFVLPFMFGIMKNTNAWAEIIVEDQRDFFDHYGKKIANLMQLEPRGKFYGIDIHGADDFKGVIANTQRFVRSPKELVSYTYIVDVDIIMDKAKYKAALKNNLEGMKKNKAAFFNFVREGREVLSGIHFVKDKDYYPKLEKFLKELKKQHKDDFIKNINAMGDEGFLYQFVKSAFGDPKKLTKGNERILPGDHLSPNRNKTYPHIKEFLCKDKKWEAAFKQFDPKFIELLS